LKYGKKIVDLSYIYTNLKHSRPTISRYAVKHES